MPTGVLASENLVEIFLNVVRACDCDCFFSLILGIGSWWCLRSETMMESAKFSKPFRTEQSWALCAEVEGWKKVNTHAIAQSRRVSRMCRQGTTRSVSGAKRKKQRKACRHC